MTTTDPRRPVLVTEAQLRWAQFHQKRTAQHVQAVVERLWETPSSPSQVAGADHVSEEQDCSSADGSSRPAISRGRRALLRVSQQKLAERQAAIRRDGFSFDNHSRDDNNNDEDALATIFAEGYYRRRRRRQQRQDPERLERFESAFRSMVQALHRASAATTTNKQPIKATKRWSRPTGQHVVLTVDGREYADLKWGVVARRKLTSSVRSPYHPTPTTMTTTVPVPDDAVGFVQQFVAQMQEASAQLIAADGKLHKPAFARLVLNYFSSLESSSSSSSSSRSRRMTNSRSVQTFCAQLERAAVEQDEDDIITPQGTLDTAVLEKLVTRYLAQAAEQVGQELQNGTPLTTSPTARQQKTNESYLTTTTTETTRRRLEQQFDQHNNSSSSRRPSGWKDSVSSRVGGWMKRLQSDTTSSSELQAVAAFRKTQDGRNNSLDDTSSTSSFRVLPAGIKHVVQNYFGNKQQRPAEERVLEEEEDDEESYPEIMQGSASFESLHTTTSATSSGVTLSPERLREFHQKMMEHSRGDASIIDTDGSDTSGADMAAAANLLLSPTLLTKRHQQAIGAIENRNWEQVAYLMSANPWLAEMPDVKSSQYLLHKLAYYGSGEVNVDPETGMVVSIRHAPVPDPINTDLIRMFAAAVHKFDQDGNLPLHMACASGNEPMIQHLGDRFPSGASVRNCSGMLPLHLTILSCAAPISALDDDNALGMVQTVLRYFCGAIAVTDNEGNLPIHTAASVLTGDVGVDIIYLLLDEAERQVQNPDGVRFRNKITMDDIESQLSSETASTATPTDSSNNVDELLHCNMVVNDRGETPLTVAILARAGWEVIEAIAGGPGGAQAALCVDAEENTALHLLASSAFLDPDAVLSILKVAPKTAGVRNAKGMLPIEVASMQMLPRDVILALILADLPIDLDREYDVEVVEGRGASWWYVVSECDDFHVDVVEHIIASVSYSQAQALCLVKGPSGESILERATPECRSVLQASLRLMGRFELADRTALFTDSVHGLKVFNAFDFGDGIDAEPKRVLLKTYSDRKAFERESSMLGHPFDFQYVEEIISFTIDKEFWNNSTGEEVGRYFVSIEQPSLTLDGVMEGMLRSEECQRDAAVRRRYGMKVFSVLRMIAKAIRHLHQLGLVHGNVNAQNCCKYDDKWKLADVLGSQQVGASMRISRLSASSPPESVEPLGNSRGNRATFRSDCVCSTANDCWAFGKMAFEVLTGRDLLELDNETRFEDGNRTMMDLMRWNSFKCEEVYEELRSVGVSENGAALISQCLSVEPENRPLMDEVLNHNIWKDLRETKRSGAT